MAILMLVTGWIICGLLGLFGVAIVWKIFDGTIDLSKLISEPNGDASMSRLQFLIFTFVIAASLFLIVISQGTPAFPDEIPPTVLSLLGISASSYLVSKGIQFSDKAGLEPRDPEISIVPANPTVAYGGTCQFALKRVGLKDEKVTWSIIAGGGIGATIGADDGLLKAPAAAPAASPGTHHATVKAEVVGKPEYFDLAVVTFA